MSATLIDINDRYYHIYAVTDNNNEIQYYDKLVIEQLNDTGTLEHYLTMTFDQYSRPASIVLPDNNEQILLDHISDSQLSVTVKDADGTIETVTINNPFAKQIRNKKKHTENITKRSSFSRGKSPHTNTIKITYTGDINSCYKENNTAPKVSVKRNFSSTLQNKYPILSQSFDARVYAFNDADEQTNFSYSYDISIPGNDFNSWQRWCVGENFFNASFGFLGQWEKFPSDTVAIFRTLSKDYREKSIKNSGIFIFNKFGDYLTKGIPIISFFTSLNTAWGIEGSGSKGPCSKSVWSFIRKRSLHEQTITVKDKNITELQVYKPVFKWNSITNDYSQTAAKFDFSQGCKEEEKEEDPYCKLSDINVFSGVINYSSITQAYYIAKEASDHYLKSNWDCRKLNEDFHLYGEKIPKGSYRCYCLAPNPTK